MDSDDFISSSFVGGGGGGGGGGGIENANLKRIFGFLDTQSLHEMKRPSKRFKECVESVLDERLPNVNYDNKIYLQLITSSNTTNNNNSFNNINNNDDDSYHWLTGGLYAGNITVQVTNPSLYKDKQPEEKEHLKHYYEWRIQKCMDNTSSSDADAYADDALDPMHEEVEVEVEVEGETMEGQQHRIKYGDIIYLQKVNINEYSENKWLKGGEGYNQASVNTLDLLETTATNNSNSSGGCSGADSYQWKIRSCTPLLTQQSYSFNNNDMDIDPKHGRTVKYNDPICLQMINNHQNRWLCGDSINGCVNSIPFDGQQQQQYYNDNNTNNPFDDDVSPMLSFRFRIRKEFVL